MSANNNQVIIKKDPSISISDGSIKMCITAAYTINDVVKEIFKVKEKK
jgi:hypothetical protein